MYIIEADDIDQWTTSQVKRDSETSKKELLFSASEGKLLRELERIVLYVRSPVPNYSKVGSYTM